MGRGDIMTGRKRSGWGYALFAIAIFALLYGVRHALSPGVTPPPPPPPPGSAHGVGDAVQRAYNTLASSFREKVPISDFATMFHRMTSPDYGGELPTVRQASVTDSTGPEHPVARLRVEYPSASAKAEYHFARIDGLWQLQSFTVISTDLDAGRPEPVAPGPSRRAQEPPKSAPAHKAPDGAAPSVPAAGALPATPCDYIVQPGDTLSAISRHFYGTIRHWRRILEANPGLSERNLRVGRRIRIPSNPEPPAPREDSDAHPPAP